MLDILLMLQPVEFDHTAVRAACKRIFDERATHPWPIHSFDFPPAWRGILTELAREVRYDTDDVSVIETRFNSYLAQLQGAPVVPNYDYPHATRY